MCVLPRESDTIAQDSAQRVCRLRNYVVAAWVPEDWVVFTPDGNGSVSLIVN